MGALSVCQLLMMNDARFAWCILVPRIAGLRELHDIPKDKRISVFDEIEAVSTALAALVAPDKLNVAALGNQVPQLHIHVIARHVNDSAWPAPVWGSGAALPYAGPTATDRVAKLARHLHLG